MATEKTKGSTAVHDISFSDDKIEWRRRCGLASFREFDPKEWPVPDEKVGNVLRQRVSTNSEPIYYPPKGETNDNLASVGSKELKEQDRTFGGALHMAILQAQGDGAPGDSNESSQPGASAPPLSPLDAAISVATASAPNLAHHWAEKKARQHRKVVQIVLDDLKEDVRGGQGRQEQGNTVPWYNAERAVSELRQSLIKREWDQRVICNVSKAKALFSTMFKKEKEENEARRKSAKGEREPSGSTEVHLTLEEANGEEVEELEAGTGTMHAEEAATEMVGFAINDDRL